MEERKMIKSIMKPRYKGYTLEISLDNWGYKEHFVECTYRFVKRKEKYALSMWLCHKNLDDRMKLSSKGIDTQYIHGIRDTIEENVCRVVHQMCISKTFDYFVKQYEYELKCFDRGHELFEQESLAKLHDSEK